MSTRIMMVMTKFKSTTEKTEPRGRKQQKAKAKDLIKNSKHDLYCTELALYCQQSDEKIPSQETRGCSGGRSSEDSGTGGMLCSIIEYNSILNTAEQNESAPGC